ncbi:MAG TPA: hypothetical protein VIL85_11925 [Thermomicrobiales bacterium]|jgi:hypothetical protein
MGNRSGWGGWPPVPIPSTAVLGTQDRAGDATARSGTQAAPPEQESPRPAPPLDQPHQDSARPEA